METLDSKKEHLYSHRKNTIKKTAIMSHIIVILEYIVDSFIHIWSYLLITIPIAVAVQMSGAANTLTGPSRRSR